MSWLLAALLPWRPSAANQCTIRYSNCAYELKLVGLGCSAPRNGLSAMADMMQRDEATRPENLSSAPYVSMKQLKDVEKRLLNVVEELSVRTLRHMRHIRNNLRTMNYMIGAEGAGRGGAGACPAEFLGIGSWPACYRFSAFSATWQEAKEYCNAFGADLVAVDSIKESYIVDYLIKSKLGEWKSAFTYLKKRYEIFTARSTYRRNEVNKVYPIDCFGNKFEDRSEKCFFDFSL